MFKGKKKKKKARKLSGFLWPFQGLSHALLSLGGKTRGHSSTAVKQPIQRRAVSSRPLFQQPLLASYSSKLFFFPKGKVWDISFLPPLFPHKKLADPAGSFSAQPCVATRGRAPESAGAGSGSAGERGHGAAAAPSASRAPRRKNRPEKSR